MSQEKYIHLIFLGLKISPMLPPGSNTFKREALNDKPILFCLWKKKNQVIC